MKPIRRPPRYRCIRYSCTTGKAVFVYQGQSRGAMRWKYHKAWRREQSRVRWWPRKMKRREANIRRLLDECIAGLPLLGELAQEQRDAIRTLRRLMSNPPRCDTAFHSHVRTERRRRKADQEMNRQMREHDEREQTEQQTLQAAQEAEKQPAQESPPETGENLT